MKLNKRISKIEGLSEFEEQLILGEFNETDIDYPRDKTVVQLFEEQEKRTPENVAVVFEEEQLTYKELNEKVNVLAHKLRELGVGPDDYVAIMTKRSLQMIIGIYGIIKAGAAYVPLDPTYPTQRIKYMLEDCRPKAVLTYQAEVETGIPTIDLGGVEVWEGKCENPSQINQPQDLLYCIYTSGTTGKPKGVMITHRNVINLVQWQLINGYYEATTTVLQNFNYIFDGSVWEIFPVLLSGGTLEVVPRASQTDPQKLLPLISGKQVLMTPSLFKMLVDYATESGRIGELNSFERLYLGGEALPYDLLKSCRQPEDVYNLYGPTEATVCATVYRFDQGHNKILIGKPIANTQVYIMNEGALCGVGVPGELCIAGAGVARGYLNQPELTAAKFIDNPYGEGRLYLTGDSARWLLDGNIEYLGRIDEQVKIRGFRIELGEIESTIRALEKVKNCVVVAKEDALKGSSGEQAIYAYMVSDSELNLSQIREHLVKSLPDYMIPSYMTQIESIPLTRNGKLDKCALPGITAKTETEYVAPQTEIEEELCVIFAEILGVEQVGIKDSFFELGGHSLKATKLVNLLESKMGVRIELEEVFRDPTVEGLAVLVTEAVRILYEPIPKAEVKEYYEISSVQKRIYLIGQMNPEAVTYNIPQSLKLTGAVDLEKIAAILQELVNRHEILRTAFIIKDEELVQDIQQQVNVDFKYGSAEGERIEDLVSAFVKPFDLSVASQLRAKAINMGDYHLLLFDMHHIISDGMSMVTLINEFTQLYNGKELEPITHQFKDYSEWMRTRDLSKQRDYWMGEFSDEIPTLDLPLDYARPRIQSFEGAVVEAETGKELGGKVKELARQTKTTEYMIFLASVMVLLGKYANQEDVVIGSPISGRTHKDTEAMLGMFANTLAMRGRPEKEKSFEELLDEVKASSLKAFEHQEYPFEELLEQIDLKRDLSRSPLFDVMLVLQNNEGPTAKMDDVSFEYISVISEVAKFDLTFNIWEVDGSYGITLSYCSALFKQETIELMLEHYVELLQNLLNRPAAKLKEASMITASRKQQILETFNGAAIDCPNDKTVAMLLEERVAKTPHSLAVVLEGEHLTYEELNIRANVLAHKLRGLGVGADDYVMIIAERSVEMIVGIYGIIKAGGAYVPIDPTYPTERIQYILEDCQPKVVLTYLSRGEKNLEEFGRKEGFAVGNNCSQTRTVPVIDLGEAMVWEGKTENPLHLNKAENLLYLIYTSGTTGQPKGVMVEHRNLISLATGLVKTYKLDERDRLLQSSTISFDPSAGQIFMALLSGATLCLINKEILIDVDELRKYIKNNRITYLANVPSLLKNIDLDGLNDLRVIVSGGEICPPEFAAKWCEKFEFHNVYGPTETTVVSIVNLVNKEQINSNIPIGKPIPNDQAYILDANHQLVPIGVFGELYIGGVGVTRGYLNRPELTEAVFIPNPFIPSERMYRTGDLARWLPDGNIEFLGRVDHQVKIRGFRIELGEIESQILKLDFVKETIVLVREELKERYLCAYVVAEAEILISTLREHLSAVLPDYMVPTHFIQLEEFPLTPNGKVDREALLTLEGKSSVAYAPPRNETEAILVEIWSEVLNKEQVGIDDNFFELGGHSLRATRLVNQMEAKTGVRIPLKEIFLNPTVKALAQLITEADNASYISIPKAEKKEYYEMSSAQKRIYLIGEMDPEAVTYNMPQSLKLRGEVRPEAIKEVLQQLINRHEVLRTSFMVIDGKAVQLVHEGVAVDFEYVDSRGQKQEKIEHLMAEFVKPFDLSKASQIRIKLINMEDYHLLLFDMHHIISDGMSMAILINEFKALYSGKKLESLTHQFKDYSEWMGKKDLRLQSEYWLGEFSDEIPVLDLPLDYARPKMQSFTGAVISLETSQELGNQVKELARKTGTTEYMIFLASAMVLLGMYANQEDVIIGSPISGRTHKDTEKMLGMFVNTLAMRGRPEKEKSFACLLEEVKVSSLKAFEFQEYPFEELVENIDIRRDLSRNPLFDVMLVMQNNEEAEFTIDEVLFEHAEVASLIARFDLTFNIKEINGSFEIALEYSTALFKKETVKLMLGHFIELLRSVLASPENKLKEISMLTEFERRQILEEFNDTAVAYQKDKTTVALFEEQVRKTPENIAVIFENEEMTYKELNEKVNVLAHKLRELGVGPDDYVAIMTKRSILMIIGIYGIIKAGGAYVPIDPTYPTQRIRYMLEDCSPKVILTDHSSMESNDGGGALAFKELKEKGEILAPVIDLKAVEGWEGKCENPTHVNQPKDLLYCIYTSGTTGKPKGVMITHRNVMNLVQWQLINGYYEATTTVLQNFNYIFDGFVWEMFPVLLSGGTLEIVPEAGHYDLKKVLERLPGKQITMTPSMFRLLVEYAVEHQLLTKLNGFERLFLAGELLSDDLLERYKATAGSKIENIFNAYGPTEATVCATVYRFDQGHNKILIGKPIGNTQVYIMTGGVLCGIGVPGELCIAGAGVARGYLNQPELTAAKFIDNPYGEGRLYLTGDSARWLPDGNIEYLGRIDEQVKVRGFRIELGEIEKILRKTEKIKDCAVILREDEGGEQAIYAYFISDEELSASQVKTSLVKLLPDYMIPAYMMQIESIPLTRNGKLDKRALPGIETKTETEYVPPRTEIEEKLCLIFAKILGVKQVGIKDSFFELGGHSLRATRLVNMLESETGVRIALKEVFRSPTVEALAELVTKADRASYIPIPKAENKEYYEMSSAQKRIYLIGAMAPEAITYNMPQSLKLIGGIIPEKVEKALQELINRHEILRTSFIVIDGKLVQRVHDQVEVDFEYVDFRGQKQEKIEHLMAEFVKPFALEKASQLRAKLINMEAYHLLLFDMHHIINDGMSMTILINEFQALYNGENLEPLTHQFKDYSEWMKKKDLSQQKAYWLGEFSDEIPVLDLPLDYVRPKIQSYKGAIIGSETGKELGGKIKELARQTGTTEYMVFLASTMVLLGMYANQEDVVIGSPISGRTHQDTEKMLGMFVNTLAMRGRPEKEKSFKRLLTEVKASSLKAFEFQEYPFEELVENVNIKRDLSRSPLFDVMLTLQNNEEAEFKMDEVLSEHTGGTSTVAKFDLTFSIREIEGSFEIALEYCSALFKKETVELMLEHFIELLRNLLAKPASKLKEISMLTEFERRQILDEFNNTAVMYPKDKTVVALFEEQVAKTPENIAVIFEDEEMTFKELNAKANALAHKLRELEIGPGDYVGIMAERSTQMIIGIYGVIKSGGAYVPIDPTYPIERIKYMLEDSNPKAVLIYHSRDEINLREDGGCSLAVPVIDLREVEGWEGATENPTHVNQPEDLLYCIYTSGSTGKPKGVMIEHKNIVNYCHNNRLNIKGQHITDECRSIISVTEISFDIFITENILSLLNGMTTILANDTQQKNSIEFLKLVRKHQVDVLQTTPSKMKLYLSDKENIKYLHCFKVILLGGEPYDVTLNDTFKNFNMDLVNVYGPTETTVWSTATKIAPDLESKPTIGRPIANTRVYIMNNEILCGIGIPGQLCIAGAGVARGYLNQPELTAAKFIDNPYGEGKLYLTGDLARWLPDGNIEHLGRVDHQVKIRGFRIELGEIESQILQLDQVREVIVVATRSQKWPARGKINKTEDKYLCAYVVCAGEIETREIRNYLKTKLPQYMIPSHFVKLDKIPLTPNGKIDQNKLRTIKLENENHIKISPRSLQEEIVAEIWKDILGLDEVYIDDDFFELGGNSLNIIQVADEVQKRLEIKVDVADLFVYKRVIDLVEFISSNTGKSQYKHVHKINKSTSEDKIFIIHGGDGSIFYYRHLAKLLEPKYSVYGIEASGINGKEPFPSSYYEMTIDYIKEIKSIQPKGPYIFSGFCVGGFLSYDITRIFELQGEEVKAFLGLDLEPFIRKEFYKKVTAFETVLKVVDRWRRITKKDKIYTVEKMQKLFEKKYEISKERQMDIIKDSRAIAYYFSRELMPESGYCSYGRKIKTPALIVKSEEHHNELFETESWENMAKNFEFHEIPGSHQTVLLPPYVEKLGDLILNFLDSL